LIPSRTQQFTNHRTEFSASSAGRDRIINDLIKRPIAVAYPGFRIYKGVGQPNVHISAGGDHDKAPSVVSTFSSHGFPKALSLSSDNRNNNIFLVVSFDLSRFPIQFKGSDIRHLAMFIFELDSPAVLVVARNRQETDHPVLLPFLSYWTRQQCSYPTRDLFQQVISPFLPLESIIC
jgi:hypothetical protein